jgi:alpha-ketoglutarate-dependent taurine dioxygenase
MKTRALKNYGSSVGVEAYDIDFNNPAEVTALGHLVAEQLIVFVDQQIPTNMLYNSMTTWGQSSRALIHNYIADGKLNGRHWREIYLNLGLVGKQISRQDKEMARAVSMVSYKKDEQNRPTGLFPNGELDWHSDQCALDDAPRTIGLQSVSDTVNSQTQFLCTHDAYESLSADMRSMVKDLVCKHKWYDNVMAPGLARVQTLVIHYNMVPLDGMETNLYSESATGLSGIKFPSHSFDGFVGMSRSESDRILDELKSVVYNDKYVYTQNWQDGQIVFMDQEITLHKRPTNVKDGDLRTMSRVITYLDKLYPNHSPVKTVKYRGQTLSHDDFATLVDADRLRVFEEEQHGEYV